MAINQIETGYKPEFGLGAMWAGENAANAEMANQLDFIKQFLANQREQQMQPLDVGVRQWEAAAAQDKMNDPLFRQMVLKGGIGKNQSDAAKGQLDAATIQSLIDLTQAQHAQGTGKANLISIFQNAQQQAIDALGSPQQDAPIPTPQPEMNAPTSGFNWQVSPQAQQARDRQPLGIMLKELEDNPNDLNLIKDIQNRKKTIGNFVPQQEQVPQAGLQEVPQPQQTAPLGSRYRQIANILKDTPEHIGRMEELAASTDAKIQVANITAEARLKAAQEAASNGDTIKAKDLSHSAKLLSDALGYEKLINGQDIQAQKDALLMKIAGGDKAAKNELSTLNANVERWKQLAQASREKAAQIDKKYGYETPSIAPVANAPQAPSKVIKLD